MKTIPCHRFIALLVLALATLHYQRPTLHAQGTAFTYQGRLQNIGSPVSGAYSLTFALFNTNTAGTAVAGPVTNNAVSVTNGLFTTTIDFLAGAFTGATNWLQIGVTTNGGTNFILLSPRQQLTPVPYAIFAGAAGNLNGTVPLAQLPGAVVTNNNVTGVNLNGTFTGNGAALASVNAIALNGLNATNFWQVGGNSGVPTGLNYLGNSDNQYLDLHANGVRAMRLRLQPDAAALFTNAPNVLGGSSLNLTAAGVVGAVIGGGGGNATNSFVLLGAFGNEVEADFGTIGGGIGNTNSGTGSFIGGGGYDGQSVQGNLISSTAPASVIGGGVGNTIANSSAYAFVGGGQGNYASAEYATVGGGAYNTVEADGAFIGGGGLFVKGDFQQNTIYYGAASAAIVAGGNNTIFGGGQQSFIGGGANNTVGGALATIGGGESNQATNTWATVPGGIQNVAGGEYSFAAGQQAQALYQGDFVWADSQDAAFSSTTNDQFLIRAQGGVGINMNNPNGASLYVQGNRTPPAGNNGWEGSVGWFENISLATNAAPALRVVCDGGTNLDGALSVSSNGKGLIAEFGNAGSFVVTITNNGSIYATAFNSTSDRNAKENFTPVNAQEVLARVAALPLLHWNFKVDSATRHIGPMAQDFYQAFNVGTDDKHIATVDEDGVALAAIQGLNQKLDEKDAEIQSLKQQNDSLAARLNILEAVMKKLAASK